MVIVNSKLLDKIKKLTEHGTSLNNIQKLTGLSKTTIYYHVRKIKGRTIVQPSINFKSEKTLGEVVGIFAGDGSLNFVADDYRYTIRIHSSIYNFEYLLYVKKLYERCFKTKFRICKYNTRRFLEKQSKMIYNFFFNYIDFNPHDKANTVKLKSGLSREFKIGYLKGILDTDGTVCNTKTGKKIAIYTSSDFVAPQIRNIIEELGFACGMSKSSKDVYSIYLLSRDVDRFIRFVKPFSKF